MKVLKSSMYDTWYLPEISKENYKGVINFYLITNSNKGYYLNNEYYFVEYIEYCGEEIIYQECATFDNLIDVQKEIRRLQEDHCIML